MKLCKLALLLACLTAGPVSADALDEFLFDETQRFRDQLRSRLPPPAEATWLENPELRVSPEVDERNQSIQTYSLRFRATNKGERRAKRRIETLENEIGTVEWDQSISTLLQGRYHYLIDVAELELQLALAEGHLELDRAILASERSLSRSPAYDSSKLTSALLRAQLRERQYRSIGRELEFMNRELREPLRPTPGPRPTLARTLIDPTEIASSMARVAEDLSHSHETRIQHLEVRHAREELALEKSRSRFGLELLEIGYEDRITDRYNMTFGFRLPFARSKYGGNRRLRDLIRAEESALLNRAIMRRALADETDRIYLLLEKHHAAEASLQALTVRFENTSSDAEFPVLRRHELELLAERADAHVDALHALVDLLDMAGILVGSPRRNWIRGI